MNILVLSLIFSPDNVSTAQIWAGIAEDLQRAGHKLRVITTTPHFHRDASMEARQPLRNWIGRLVRRSEYAGIPVYHVLMPNKGIWPPLRILSWINFHILATLLGWFVRFKPDVVIAPSPPLTSGLNAWAIAAIRRAMYIYNVQEIYPDIAVNLGVMKNKLLIRFFGWLERLIYRKAARVTSITKTMCDKIATRTCPEKVRLVPNFVDLSDVVACPRDNAFAAEHRLGGKFVLTYAGNMGIPQRLDVMFVDYQPISRMPEIYAASDLFYVGQDASACSDGIPSKIYRILGYCKPLAVMTRGDSDLASFVRESGGGVLLDEDLDAAARTVAGLMEDKARLASYGENGRKYVTKAFDRASVSSRYEEICKETLEGNHA